jgi:hypothetical protein
MAVTDIQATKLIKFTQQIMVGTGEYVSLYMSDEVTPSAAAWS